MIDQPLDLFSSTSDDAGPSRVLDVPSHAKASVVRDTAPHVAGSRTSKKAAEAIEPRRPVQRERVLTFLLSCGAHGCTRPELALGTGLSENSVRPRVLELMEERDEVYGTPRVVASKRTTRNGCALLYAGKFARDVLHREDAGAVA
jgi:hypothetical protein